ncbi:FliG C-terminal domain-containing protein [Parvularcula dongshanensis]|uniref:Flagellar motor switch protein FliG n=1 Tax=Parvularcula dongshanensis TaxID=1173995 RepID=A0A840I421_9PROT|nr:FliG C-terminal domain-containing protein [Parvularcula dongshanensis]MBB4659619.1 flagellar motor switch protein FliG [Parvularcula dongshanensis]
MSLTPRDETLPATKPAAPETALPPLSADEQAAVILALLGEKGAAQLSGRLGAHHRPRLEAAVRSLRTLNVRQQRALAARFAEALAIRKAGPRGGEEAATALTDALFGPAMPALPPAEAEPPKTLWDRLAGLKPEDVAAFLAEKGPTIAGLALSHLPEAFAAEVAGALPEGDAAKAVARVAGDEVGEPAMRAVCAVLETAFFSEGPGASRGIDELKAAQVAGLLNRLPTARREAALAVLAETVEPAFLAAIKKRVLGFDALATRLPRNAVPILFREMEEAALLKALAYATARGSQTPEYFYGNISQRLAGQLKERMAAHAGIAETAGEKAQAEVVGFVLTASADGRISLLDEEA